MTKKEAEVVEGVEKRIYHIPAINVPRLVAEIAKLNHRAEKLGCQPIIFNCLSKGDVLRKDETVGVEYTETIHHCTIEGESPKLEGWTIVAILEPVRNGEMLIREVPGQKCPIRFRSTDLRCDHCQKVRRRNAVYVLRHDVHGYHQVGKQCLADFVGNANPENLLGRAEYFLDFAALAEEAEKEGWGRGGTGSKLLLLVPIQHFVAVVSVVSRKVGWVPKSKATEDTLATADLCWNICVNPRSTSVRDFVKQREILAEETDMKLSTEAIQWASQIDSFLAASTYLHDLGVCCRQEYVERKTAGFVASVIGAYRRHLDYQQKQVSQCAETKSSHHEGEVGKRCVFEDVTINFVKVMQNGQFTSTLVRFISPDGSVLFWYASGTPAWIEKDRKVTIRATVKEHSSYNGVPQTVLSRVSLEGADTAKTA